MRFVLGFWAVVALSTVTILYVDGLWQAGALAWLTASAGSWLQRAAERGRRRLHRVRVDALRRGLAHAK